MKSSLKITFTTVLIATLGLAGLMRSVYAQQPHNAVAIMPQYHSNTLVAEASDGDGEANDATEAPENNKSSQSLANFSDTQVAEASDGDGETNDDAEEQETNKLQTLAKITLEQAQQAAQSAVGGKASS